MPIEKITMPKLGESVTEGTISNWLIAVGDVVNKYDPLAEVMTDKVNAEIPSSFSGKIKELIAEEGQTLDVGEVICTIEVEGDKSQEEQSQEEKTVKKEADISIQADTSQKTRYSPAVLRLSQEAGIDLALLKGTGTGGRITRKDVQKAISDGVPQVKEEEKAPVNVAVTPPKETVVHSSIQTKAGDKELPITGVRKAIASNMVKSKHEIPHAWTMIEVDVTKLVQYRNKVKDSFKKEEGYNLTFFAFFVKAVARALKEFPEINSTWAGDKIIQKKDINISIAVATEGALFVPVIKNADEKSIKGIAREITELANKARTGKLTIDEMQDGTFTVNNTGSFGSIQSMGIINHPQAAILQVESIVKRPVIKENMIAISDMVNLCMSLDHRVLDGLVCGRFLQRIKEILETTSEETTPIY
ncbi:MULTISPECIES: dihydrolipoamide acetyltransferase family protein [Bacillaceae]|uniref:dihydrolipoamide acetyltransferase family protein n=1 Tax=Bacillaceae TaxID=186817 RepID=UPI001F1D7E74|nr:MULTISPECIES: dihydrolipoamide acetyltransferase family protein [Bacillaceae]MCF2649801.1 2-oxo acid dehydrogenase subunit E2 [Niallia circulans]MCM3362952.1 2-oxo acid dehydrogenase subunit E2 [Niallia sp. MER TA 168]CAI9388933.1 Dihydrolipoyllysine-residue acetyltransferase component of pyruvate dehydrogenase complex [Bacillus sp. T2.9-1]